MTAKLYKYVTYLFLISLLFTGISFSRFSTTLTNDIEGSSPGSSVTNPIILYIPKEGLASGDSKILTLNNIQPGSPIQSYYFEIVNYKDGKTSDMEFIYTISLESLGALPLEFKVYDFENKRYIPLIRYQSAQITMPKNITTTHKYRLDIAWDLESDDYRYSQEIDYVKIIVNAHQAQ